MTGKEGVVMKREITKTITGTVYDCDICGHEESILARCPGCDRDICGKCSINYTHDPFTGDYVGDYRIFICHQCEHELKCYREQIEDLQIELENLETEWINKCRKLLKT